MTDIIIIGGGPAGMSAAIYAVRAGLSVKIFEKNVCGGQMTATSEIDNYPGIKNIAGWQLANDMYNHISELGVDVVYEEIQKITESENGKLVITDNNVYECKSVIIANGAKRRKIGCPGEIEFTGKGVSYCAVCDGAFFRGKTVAVIGGGNTALEDAEYLSKICEKVFLVHRRSELRGEFHLQNAVKEKENIGFLFNKIVKEIIGTNKVESVILSDVTDKSETTVSVDAVFVAIGLEPDNERFRDIVALDEYGYIVADESCKTSCDGIYVAGDTRTKQLRQIITACSDGAMAALCCRKP